jgi:hypothetical protein
LTDGAEYFVAAVMAVVLPIDVAVVVVVIAADSDSELL